MAVSINIDIEATNRCNAICHFCPRDATPHQGHMTMETFDQALYRAVEFRDINRPDSAVPLQVRPNICGLGEPLINPNTPEFIRKVRDAGFSTCGMSSNGALLDKKRGDAILKAGVTSVNINISDLGEEYERIYNPPYEETRDNIVRFINDAGTDCEVQIVLVNHRKDPGHTARMEEFWRGYGVNRFMKYEVINRGGALFVDHMQYEKFAERRAAELLMEESGQKWVCPVPYLSVFIGYDGLYYLCCSDWKKEAPMASVFEASVLAISEQKLHHVTSREPVCRSCNHDPLNAVTDKIRAVNAGDTSPAELDKMVAVFTRESEASFGAVASAVELVPQVRLDHLETKGKRLIPVIAT
ncbi:MAG: radical SAM protein [Halioglobus sp.]|nr:radical SAM protein [Halioglobus sp.]